MADQQQPLQQQQSQRRTTLHGCGHNLGCQGCNRDFDRLDYTIRRRGAQIGGLYCALQSVLAQLEQVEPQRIVDTENVPVNVLRLGAEIQPDQEALILQHIQDLRRQIESLGGPATPFEIPANFACNVCFEAFDTREHLPVTLMCGHFLCLGCLGNLRRLKCPSCRETIRGFTRLFV